MIAAASIAAGLLFATCSPVVAGTLTAEVDGVRVELLSNPSHPEAKADTQYVVRLVGQAGQPVTGAQVTLRGGMADGMSVIAPLRPTEEAGIYRGRVLFNLRQRQTQSSAACIRVVDRTTEKPVPSAPA